MMAVNEKQGIYSGYCDEIDICIDADTFSLSGKDRISFGDHEFWIFKDRFFFYSASFYVGNIIWNNYKLSNSEALRLLKRCKESGNFNLQEAPTKWFEWWEKLDCMSRYIFK